MVVSLHFGVEKGNMFQMAAKWRSFKEPCSNRYVRHGRQGRLAGELGLNELLQHRAVQPRGGPGPRDLVGVQGPPEA